MRTSGPGPLSIVVAGGGTAGHIEPAMAVADALRALDPTMRITALGTTRGLEQELVPARGYDLKFIDAVPLPRKVTKDLFLVPSRLRASVKQAYEVMQEVQADALVGFGGYVSMSAYLAAHQLGHPHIPYVVHEANARAGIANKICARHAQCVLGAVADCGLRIEPENVVGIPVRPSISSLDRQALRHEAREHFGLPQDQPVLLQFGGSQGAQSLNRVMFEASPALVRRGISVLQAVGPKNYNCDEPLKGGAPEYIHRSFDVAGTPARDISERGCPAHIQVPYIADMNLAYAAADVVMCRSGAMTVAEISAVGLPALYVPLPIGNGEQALNAGPVVDAGGGSLINDHDLTPEYLIKWAQGLLFDRTTYQRAEQAALSAGSRNAAQTVADVVLRVAQGTSPTETSLSTASSEFPHPITEDTSHE